MSIDFNLHGTMYYDDRAGVWVTRCEELGIHCQGTSKFTARQALNEGVRAYLKVCYNRGILNDVLLDKRLTPDLGYERPDSSFEFKVSIPFG